MINTKMCRKCEKVKPLLGFYKNHRMKDGHLNSCKKNRAGSKHFYYSVLWSGTKTESTHSQMRLALVEDTQSE